jgi:hypothetical protein
MYMPNLKALHELILGKNLTRAKFAPACDADAADPASVWPTSLRVKSMRNAAGVLEMTWSFASPDGRATFEFITVTGGPRCRWRRVGSHSLFSAP